MSNHPDSVSEFFASRPHLKALNPELCGQQKGAEQASKAREEHLPKGNKYGAVRTWSELCQVWFGSKGEAHYGSYLFLRQKAGEISRLEFHKKFVLCEEPKRRTVEVDFVYLNNQSGELQYEEFKGAMTRDYETRVLWLYQLDGIEVKLVK